MVTPRMAKAVLTEDPSKTFQKLGFGLRVAAGDGFAPYREAMVRFRRKTHPNETRKKSEAWVDVYKYQAGHRAILLVDTDDEVVAALLFYCPVFDLTLDMKRLVTRAQQELHLLEISLICCAYIGVSAQDYSLVHGLMDVARSIYSIAHPRGAVFVYRTPVTPVDTQLHAFLAQKGWGATNFKDGKGNEFWWTVMSAE